jgi:hypothetical protein
MTQELARRQRQGPEQVHDRLAYIITKQKRVLSFNHSRYLARLEGGRSIGHRGSELKPNLSENGTRHKKTAQDKTKSKDG